MRRGIGLLAAATIALPLALVGTSQSGATASYAADECTPGVMARLPGPPAAFAQMGLVEGEARPTGSGVVVAVVDSGIDATRPQFTDAFAPGSTSLVSDGERPDGLGDPHGHGTAVAGIIAARPASGFGAVGIAPDATLISIRVFRGDDDQSRQAGLGPEASRVAAGIRTAVDLGATIITVALSDDVDSPELRDAAAYALENDALIVASAGNRATAANTSDSPRYPAAYPGVLSVTAVDPDGMATQSSIHGSHIDVAAPGQNVLTIASGAGDCLYAADAPSASFATAYAAGAAALLAQTHPDEGPEGWAYRLMATADRPDLDTANDLTGWGGIRPLEAIGLRIDDTTRGPANPITGTSAPAVTPPVTQVSPHASPQGNTALVVSIAAVAAGGVAVLALVARLRGRSAERERRDEPEPES